MEVPRLPENEKERLDKLFALNLLHTPAEERFDRITRLAQRVLDVPIALISLVSPDTQWFKSRQGLDAGETSRDVSFCGHAILQDETFVVRDASKDQQFADNPLVTEAPHIRFYAGQPLRFRGCNIGTLCVIDSKARSMTADDLDSLKSLALWVERELEIRALGMAQIELLEAFGEVKRKGLIDPLTGVWNRRGINEMIVRELAEAATSDQPVTLMFIDLDNFKQINDEFGHRAGDWVLREFAASLRQSVRPSDIVGRFGGDEFLVLLPGCGEEASQVIAERIRSGVASAPLQRKGIAISLTCSVGCITEHTAHGLSKDELISRADKALYRAKDEGRNRVIIHDIDLDMDSSPSSA